MTYAEGNLDFALWIEATSYSYKRFERIKKGCRRNLRKPIGEILYCPVCRKKFKKTYSPQEVCSKKCYDKVCINGH